MLSKTRVAIMTSSIFFMMLQLALLSCTRLLPATNALATTTPIYFGKPTLVSSMLQQHATSIDRLKALCPPDILSQEPFNNDVYFLRYCLDAAAVNNDNAAAVTAAAQDPFQTALTWRTNTRPGLVQAAAQAVGAASSSSNGGGNWNNAPVVALAPYSAAISQYMTPSHVITTTSHRDDLVYCIRAGQIDDAALMQAVTIEQMVDFFLYVREVQAMVANRRSLQLNRLVCLLTANDLTGVKLVGGSADFRQALSQSSQQGATNNLYPSSLMGPTLLLNLPALLSALVKLFTPLFPPAVSARIKFSQGLLRDVQDLQDVGSRQTGPARTAFCQGLEEVVYKTNKG